MSPEQHLGETTDARSDQFSFCVALYEALYNQLPFAGNTVEALAFNTISGRIQNRPSGSRVPTVVHQAILRGLATNPTARFPSMRELLVALSYDPTIDRTAGPRVRRRVTSNMIAFMLIAAAGPTLLHRAGFSDITRPSASLRRTLPSSCSWRSASGEPSKNAFTAASWSMARCSARRSWRSSLWVLLGAEPVADRDAGLGGAVGDDLRGRGAGVAAHVDDGPARRAGDDGRDLEAGLCPAPVLGGGGGDDDRLAAAVECGGGIGANSAQHAGCPRQKDGDR